MQRCIQGGEGKASSVAGFGGGQQRGRRGFRACLGILGFPFSLFSSLELVAGLGGANPSEACSGALPCCVVTSRRPRRVAPLLGSSASRTWLRSCSVVHGSTAMRGLHCTSEDMSCPDPPLLRGRGRTVEQSDPTSMGTGITDPVFAPSSRPATPFVIPLQLCDRLVGLTAEEVTEWGLLLIISCFPLDRDVFSSTCSGSWYVDCAAWAA